MRAALSSTITVGALRQPVGAQHAALVLLRYLAGVGAVAAKEMLEKATVQKELLVTRGMSEKLLDDLALAIADFEKTLEATRNARVAKDLLT